jgi:hypothetical protein
MPMQGMPMQGMPMQGMPMQGIGQQLTTADHVQQLGMSNIGNIGSVGLYGMSNGISGLPSMHGGMSNGISGGEELELSKKSVNELFYSDELETEINEKDPLGFYNIESENGQQIEQIGQQSGGAYDPLGFYATESEQDVVDIMSQKDNFFFPIRKN